MTDVAFDRHLDVVYGNRDGMALVLDVYTPEEPCSKAILWVSAGGWQASHRFGRDLASNKEGLTPLQESLRALLLALLDSGYVVFAAMHSGFVPILVETAQAPIVTF